jgi:hypothetical protein
VLDDRNCTASPQQDSAALESLQDGQLGAAIAIESTILVYLIANKLRTPLLQVEDEEHRKDKNKKQI